METERITLAGEMFSGNVQSADRDFSFDIKDAVFESNIKSILSSIKALVNDTEDDQYMYIASMNAKSVFAHNVKNTLDARGGVLCDAVFYTTNGHIEAEDIYDIETITKESFVKFASRTESDNKNLEREKVERTVQPFSEESIKAVLYAVYKMFGKARTTEKVSIVFNEDNKDVFSQKSLSFLCEIMKYLPYGLRKRVGFISRIANNNARVIADLNSAINIIAYSSKVRDVPPDCIVLDSPRTVKCNYKDLVDRIYSLSDEERQALFDDFEKNVEKSIYESTKKRDCISKDYSEELAFSEKLKNTKFSELADEYINGTGTEHLQIFIAHAEMFKARTKDSEDEYVKWTANKTYGSSADINAEIRKQNEFWELILKNDKFADFEPELNIIYKTAAACIINKVLEGALSYADFFEKIKRFNVKHIDESIHIGWEDTNVSDLIDKYIENFNPKPFIEDIGNMYGEFTSIPEILSEEQKNKLKNSARNKIIDIIDRKKNELIDIIDKKGDEVRDLKISDLSEFLKYAETALKEKELISEKDADYIKKVVSKAAEKYIEEQSGAKKYPIDDEDSRDECDLEICEQKIKDYKSVIERIGNIKISGSFADRVGSAAYKLMNNYNDKVMRLETLKTELTEKKKREEEERRRELERNIEGRYFKYFRTALMYYCSLLQNNNSDSDNVKKECEQFIKLINKLIKVDLIEDDESKTLQNIIMIMSKKLKGDGEYIKEKRKDIKQNRRHEENPYYDEYVEFVEFISAKKELGVPEFEYNVENVWKDIFEKCGTRIDEFITEQMFEPVNGLDISEIYEEYKKDKNNSSNVHTANNDDVEDDFTEKSDLQLSSEYPESKKLGNVISSGNMKNEIVNNGINNYTKPKQGSSPLNPSYKSKEQSSDKRWNNADSSVGNSNYGRKEYRNESEYSRSNRNIRGTEHRNESEYSRSNRNIRGTERRNESDYSKSNRNIRETEHRNESYYSGSNRSVKRTEHHNTSENSKSTHDKNERILLITIIIASLALILVIISIIIVILKPSRMEGNYRNTTTVTETVNLQNNTEKADGAASKSSSNVRDKKNNPKELNK